MKGARVHIGRVKFKDGGPIIYRMPPRQDNRVIKHMRASTARILDQRPQPDCYFLVTMRFDPEMPGNPEFEVTWCTEHDALPPSVLADIGASVLKSEAIVWKAHCRTMSALGYEFGVWNPDDEPEPAA